MINSSRETSIAFIWKVIPRDIFDQLSTKKKTAAKIHIHVPTCSCAFEGLSHYHTSTFNKNYYCTSQSRHYPKNAHLTILENKGNRKTTHVKDQDIERGGIPYCWGLLLLSSGWISEEKPKVGSAGVKCLIIIINNSITKKNLFLRL